MFDRQTVSFVEVFHPEIEASVVPTPFRQMGEPVIGVRVEAG
jgi:hypothetical protein